MKAFDAKCWECGTVHPIWVMFDHEEGDTIKIACTAGCRNYTHHDLVASLDGLSHREKWGADG